MAMKFDRLAPWNVPAGKPDRIRHGALKGVPAAELLAEHRFPSATLARPIRPRGSSSASEAKENGLTEFKDGRSTKGLFTARLERTGSRLRAEAPVRIRQRSGPSGAFRARQVSVCRWGPKSRRPRHAGQGQPAVDVSGRR